MIKPRWERLSSSKQYPDRQYSKPVPRISPTLTCYNDSVYLFGGVTDRQSDDWFVYHSERKYWSVFPNTDDKDPQFEPSEIEPIFKPPGRSGHTTAVTEAAPEKVYMWGGGSLKGNKCLNDMWEIDISDGCPRWLQKETQESPLAPSPRWQHTMVSVRDRLMFFGGEDSSQQILGDCHFLGLDADAVTTDNLEWQLLKRREPYPPPRHLHDACVVGDMVIIGGGLNQFGSCADVWGLDTGCMKWIKIDAKGHSPFDGQNGKTMVAGHSMCTVDGKVLWYGGRCGTLHRNTLFLLDMRANEWVEIEPEYDHDHRSPPPGWRHGMCASEKQMFVYGGYGEKSKHGELWTLHFNN